MKAPRRVTLRSRLVRGWRRLGRALFRMRLGSAGYWERRYRRGGTSGPGSYARLAAFKAEIVHDVMRRHEIESVTEWGCGDGNQLELARYPRYIGYDVSATAVRACAHAFRNDPTKSFALAADYSGDKTDAALSLDVIYHLVEDAAFEPYMANLFDSASRIVIVYSSDTDENPEARDHRHVRHREFTRWVRHHRPRWKLIEHVPNRYPFVRGDLSTSFAEFFVFGWTNA